MFIRAGLVLLAWAGLLLPARAQDDGPIKMVPEYALAFPLTQVGHDVTVRFPVLLNRSTVIKPGMILRNLYQPPNPQDDSEDLALAHKGDMSESFSRSNLSADETSKMPAQLAHALEAQRRVVWEVPINFQLAMAQLPTDNLHMIFTSKGDDRDLHDERLGFFDGLLLGSPTPGVIVLAVEIGSKADQAGFKAGDKIIAVRGIAVPDDLTQFPDIYSTAKAAAKYNEATSFPIVVQPPGGGAPQTLNMAMPPTIKSMLMQGF